MDNIERTTIVKKYQLVTPMDVKQFVWAVSKCKGEVVVVEKKFNVSGKSILGMFSLDLTQPISVEFCDVYGNEEFFDELKPWEVE